MATTEKRPRQALVKLVQYVFDHRDGLIQGMTYEALAARIGRTNKHGIGHAHGMGNVLGKMGHLLQGIEGEWGEPIPHIQSLVVQKTGPNRNLPDEGIREFWPEYPKMTRTEKMNRLMIEHQKIVDFGSRWNEVLIKLDLPPIVVANPSPTVALTFGGAGESAQHKRFKEFVRDHPEIVGAESNWDAFIEYPLPSSDQIDVVFKSAEKCIAVEVKSSVSDAFPLDYVRGIYQTIKYAALLAAMAKAGHEIPPNIHSVLALESVLPDQFRNLAKILGVTVYENIQKLRLL